MNAKRGPREREATRREEGGEEGGGSTGGVVGRGWTIHNWQEVCARIPCTQSSNVVSCLESCTKSFCPFMVDSVDFILYKL